MCARPRFITMWRTWTLSNLTLKKMISGYSNEAVAGMGTAKKIDLMAFAIAQGMTQGALPLIGYNFSSDDCIRMYAVLRVLLDCLAVAFAGMALMVAAVLVVPYLKKL